MRTCWLTTTRFLTLATTILLSAVVSHATVWNSDITTSTIWSADGSYTLVGNITITSSGALTIEEGVSIDGGGTASLSVEPGGQLTIGSLQGDPVKITGLVSITLDDCDGTVYVRNTEFTSCGDPLNVDAFITLFEGDGYFFEYCNFNTISGASIHWDEDASGGASQCGWQQWAGSPLIIGTTSQSNVRNDVSIIGNDFTGSTCGWQQWAGSPIVGASTASGVVKLEIGDNDFGGYQKSNNGIELGGIIHDDNLGGGIFDIVVKNNFFANCDAAVNLVDGAEASSVLVVNNVMYDNETGISVASDAADPCLATIANNALFDNTTGASFALDGSIPDGLSFSNNVSWENGVGFDFTVTNGASINDLFFRNNVSGENATAGIRFNTAPSTGSIHHIALKGNGSDIKIGTSDGSSSAFADDCVFHTGGTPAFSLVNENPSSYGWDFHLLVDDTWSGNYNKLINSGYGSDPNTSTADFGIYGGDYAGSNVNNAREVQANYRSVTSIEFFNDLTSWKPDLYRVNMVSPSVNMSWSGTIDGGSDALKTIIEMPSAYYITVGEEFSASDAIFRGYGENSWKGIKFTSSSKVDGSGFYNCEILNANYGLYLSGLDDASNDRLQVVDCIFDGCQVGVYNNNSRLELNGTTITGSNGGTLYGVGLFVVGCASGKVKVDGCDITDNGNGSTYTSAGIYLTSASPEIINSRVENNSGSGIACFGSTPDLDTYDVLALEAYPNTITANGSDAQSGSSGAEIYLASSSYPLISYNNISDYDGGLIGLMIYKNESSNSGALNAQNNYWGATPTSSFFFWGNGSAIDFSNYAGEEIDNVVLFNQAMYQWNRGSYWLASILFAQCANVSSGSIGVNSVHYLAGCYSMFNNPNWSTLRSTLQTVVNRNNDSNVDWTANRFIADTYVQQGNYQSALSAYEALQVNAGNVQDSLLAAIDWLAAYELSNGGELDAIGEDIPTQMGRLVAAMEENRIIGHVQPTDFEISNAYPNPFNNATRFAFNLPSMSKVNVSVFDVSGRHIASLIDGNLASGRHIVNWNADNVSAGLYYFRVSANGSALTTSATLIK